MNTFRILSAAQEYPRSPQDRLITKARAASLLSLSTRTLDRMAGQGQITKVFVNGSVRFRQSEIDLVIEKGV